MLGCIRRGANLIAGSCTCAYTLGLMVSVTTSGVKQMQPMRDFLGLDSTTKLALAYFGSLPLLAMGVSCLLSGVRGTQQRDGFREVLLEPPENVQVVGRVYEEVLEQEVAS